MGECHDWKLWKESADPVGETGCSFPVGCRSMTMCGSDFDGGDVTRVSFGGVVKDRLVLKPPSRL